MTLLYEQIPDGIFNEIQTSIPGLLNGSCKFADIDEDGDLDILAVGGDVGDIYINSSGTFSPASAGLPGLVEGSCDWGDYDNDGDLDILLAGEWQDVPFNTALVFTNTGGSFSDAGLGLPWFGGGSVEWGDVENDGDLDILIHGEVASPGGAPWTYIYENTGSGFVERDLGIQRIGLGNAAWGDHDDDGDLDILITGIDDISIFGDWVTLLYENYALVANTPPTPPFLPSVTRTGLTATFQWAPGGDLESTLLGLNYNLRLGTTSGSDDLMPSHSDPSTGQRRIVALGNIGQRISRTVELPIVSKVEWAVQAVDPGYAGSPFVIGPTIFLGPAPFSIDDVPNDQGGWVRVRFLPSDLDDASETELPIAIYNIWRDFENAPASDVLKSEGVPVEADQWESRLEKTDGPDWEMMSQLNLIEWNGRLLAMGSEAASTTLPPGLWELAGSVAATQPFAYSFVAPTLADSTVSEGLFSSIFVVSAHTTTPSIWFASDPDTGFSTDDIAPGVPQNLAVDDVSPQGDVDLSWDPSTAQDFQYYELYSSTNPAFAPEENNRVAQLIETSYTDVGGYQGGSLYYKLIAFDHAGNPSEAADATTGTVAVGDPDVPTRFALYGSVPNPIPGEGVIRFDLPRAVPVSLALYDARGRLVRRAFNGQQHPAGQHQWSWDRRDESGARVRAGIYFYEIQAGTFTAREKTVVLE